MAGSPADGGRTLDRKLVVNWDDPPSSVIDVAVVVVYEDGTREYVDDRHLSLARDGVIVEGHPLRAGERVRQAEVEWNETENPLERLAAWLSGLPEAAREFRRGSGSGNE